MISTLIPFCDHKLCLSIYLGLNLTWNKSMILDTEMQSQNFAFAHSRLIEDEKHFLLECCINHELRFLFDSRVNQLYPQYKYLDNNQKLVLLFQIEIEHLFYGLVNSCIIHFVWRKTILWKVLVWQLESCSFVCFMTVYMEEDTQPGTGLRLPPHNRTIPSAALPMRAVATFTNID